MFNIKDLSIFNIKARLFALVLGASIGAANTHSLGFGEVDVIFPRNGTFGPMTITPIVFAIQNPEAIDGIYPYISYGLWQADLPPKNQTLDTHVVTSHLHNTTGPVSFIQSSIPTTLNTENEWEFVWQMDYTNCSTLANGTTSNDRRGLAEKPEINLNSPWASRSIRFTTKKGANQPNLTALTASDKCGDTSALAFNVTKSLRPQSGYYEEKKCAVLESPASPTPCKVSISPAAASSMSSSLTARYCLDPTPIISCPAKKGGAAINNDVSSRLKWWVASVLLVGNILV
ncbi:hypothetical protein PENPOL_c006G06466 [Penicillium polonicum]|uniref:DUF7136 domain-containing protein n=1 Tax=Penicillium polonicum TaxID=60169 RepID=A0A1V6NLD2_PENPO|nr:hypothetical protein PENPOL_c006G06466 [Penicillium polonicum]